MSARTARAWIVAALAAVGCQAGPPSGPQPRDGRGSPRAGDDRLLRIWIR